MLAFYLIVVAALNLALGYWLGLIVVRPDLAWTLRHRLVFTLGEWIDPVLDLPAATWGLLMRLLGRAPVESAS
jgi:hypothetical protein